MGYLRSTLDHATLALLSGLIATSAACGGKTAPITGSTAPAQPGEVGGAGGGHGGGNQPGGQAGGSGFQCAGLALEGAPRAVLTAGGFHQDLQLVSLGSSGAVVVSVLESFGNLKLGTFDGSAAWPAEIAAKTLYPAELAPQQVLLAGGLSTGTVALVAPTQPMVPDGSAYGLRAALAEDPISPAGTFVTLEDKSVTAFPRALARIGSGLLEIDEVRHPGFSVGRLRRLGPSGSASVVIDLGCGGTGLAASIAPTPTGALIAFSSLAGACPPTGAPPLLAGNLRLARMDAPSDNLAVTEVGSSPLASEPDQLQLVRVVAHATGAWVVYQYAGVDALTASPFMAQPIALDGSPLGPPKPILGADATLAAPSVAAFGDRLAIAYVAAPGSQQVGVTVDLWDGNVQLTNTYSIPKQTSPFYLGATLLADPDGKRLTVGWIESIAEVSQPYLARLACVTP